MFKTPILFLIFNRTSTAMRVFEKIKAVRPEYLFIAGDGPRLNKDNEDEIVNTLRNNILSSIDWKCEVHTLFNDENLGCGLAPANAITWFFDNVDHGIILEDDCLPDLSFFTFCEELLIKYQDNKEIMLISGTNPIPHLQAISDSYTFTDCAGIWGWASWKRAWSHYNFSIPEWRSEKIVHQVANTFYFKDDAEILINGLNLVLNKRVDAWDYQWVLYRILNKGLGIVPQSNLISNIGFGNNATHTFDEKHILGNMPTKPIVFPLQHPLYILPNQSFNISLNNYLNPKTTTNQKLICRIYKKIKRIILNLFK